MKMWLGMLILAVFGVGWTCNALFVSAPSVAPASAREPEPDREDAFDRARSYGRRGPKGRGDALTIRWFSEELELTTEQQARLAEITEVVGEEYRECNRRVRAAEERSRREVYELLSHDQRERLQELLRDRHRRETEARIDGAIRRLKDDGLLADLTSDQESEIRSLFLSNELARESGREWCDPSRRPSGRSEVHGKQDHRGGPPKKHERGERDRKLRDRSAQLREALTGTLDEASAERLIEFYFEGRGGFRH
ncbi:MAG: hypothetical protein RL885_04705 [Planctomycetota bacterium]